MKCSSITKSGYACQNESKSIVCSIHKNKLDNDLLKLNTTWDDFVQTVKKMYGDYITNETILLMIDDLCRLDHDCKSMDTTE